MNKPNPHAGDLRKGRVSESGGIYLITCVTHKRMCVFTQWGCGRLLVTVLINEHERAETLAYVVMPDHLHWLVQLAEGTSLDRLMRTVKSVSSRQINRKLNRSGRLCVITSYSIHYTKLYEHETCDPGAHLSGPEHQHPDQVTHAE